MPHASPDFTPESSPQVAIAIMAKAPIPGLAKTRLIPHLGADGAAALQCWLLERAVNTALAAGLGPVTLWCTPDIRHPVFLALAESGAIELRQQPDGDLGERMLQAISVSATEAGCLVIGTDCPLLSPADLRGAANALLDNNAVVAPAEDGGYVLIGLRQATRRVFQDIDWSTDQVMAQTRQRLTEAAYTWHEISSFWDVDRSTDFERLLPLFPELADCIRPVVIA